MHWRVLRNDTALKNVSFRTRVHRARRILIAGRIYMVVQKDTFERPISRARSTEISKNHCRFRIANLDEYELVLFLPGSLCMPLKE